MNKLTKFRIATYNSIIIVLIINISFIIIDSIQLYNLNHSDETSNSTSDGINKNIQWIIIDQLCCFIISLMIIFLIFIVMIRVDYQYTGVNYSLISDKQAQQHITFNDIGHNNRLIIIASLSMGVCITFGTIIGGIAGFFSVNRMMETHIFFLFLANFMCWIFNLIPIYLMAITLDIRRLR